MQDISLKELLHARGMRLTKIADDLGVDKATITRWTKTRIPAERVADFERVTGLPRGTLRPDLWPSADAGVAEAGATGDVSHLIAAGA